MFHPLADKAPRAFHAHAAMTQGRSSDWASPATSAFPAKASGMN